MYCMRYIVKLKINKATTTLITFLFFKLIFGALETSVKTCEWIAMVLTWIVSIGHFCAWGCPAVL